MDTNSVRADSDSLRAEMESHQAEVAALKREVAELKAQLSTPPPGLIEAQTLAAGKAWFEERR